MPKEGKYGPIYHVARRIQVRKDQRGKWTLFFENQNQRKNLTFGKGRPALVAAIKAADSLASEKSVPFPAILSKPGPEPESEITGGEDEEVPPEEVGEEGEVEEGEYVEGEEEGEPSVEGLEGQADEIAGEEEELIPAEEEEFLLDDESVLGEGEEFFPDEEE